MLHYQVKLLSFHQLKQEQEETEHHTHNHLIATCTHMEMWNAFCSDLEQKIVPHIGYVRQCTDFKITSDVRFIISHNEINIQGTKCIIMGITEINRCGIIVQLGMQFFYYTSICGGSKRFNLDLCRDERSEINSKSLVFVTDLLMIYSIRRNFLFELNLSYSMNIYLYQFYNPKLSAIPP